MDSLGFEFITSKGDTVGQEMSRLLSDIPDIAQLIASEELLFVKFQQVESFAPTHTLKRTILDT